MDPGSVLATIAQVAAAFVGFTGVIFAVGRFSQGAWRGPERQALVHLLLPSLVALFMALSALAALTGIRNEIVVWRISNGILAVFHAPLVSHALLMSIRAEVAEPVPLRFLTIPGGYASVVLSALVAAGLLQNYAVVVFTGGLVWFLFIAAMQFVMLVLPDTSAA
jgi:hypothetical protein